MVEMRPEQAVSPEHNQSPRLPERAANASAGTPGSALDRPSHPAKDRANREDPVDVFYRGLWRVGGRREAQARRVSELRRATRSKP